VHCSVFLKSLKYFAKIIRDKFMTNFYFEVNYLLFIFSIIKGNTYYYIYVCIQCVNIYLFLYL